MDLFHLHGVAGAFAGILSSLRFFQGEPTWLAVVMIVFLATGGLALVTSWLPSIDLSFRKRLKAIRYVSFWLVWLPFWGWWFTQIEAPEKLIHNKPVLIWLAASAIAAVISTIVCTRLEDWLIYREPADDCEPTASTPKPNTAVAPISLNEPESPVGAGSVPEAKSQDTEDNDPPAITAPGSP